MVNGVQIWKPRWGENIDDTVNMSYIAAVVQRVWDNETVTECILFLTLIRQSFRNDPKKKPKKKYEDYDRVFISTMTKSYWRNLNQQVSTQISTEKTVKLTNKQTNSLHRGRRQTVANNRREAVPEFEKIYGCEGSVALIDTWNRLPVIRGGSAKRGFCEPAQGAKSRRRDSKGSETRVAIIERKILRFIRT
ncbi:hypothetical protein K503DRAFT_41098 [Rhizopogon vinicolor AM-OR11-026]|uniref:Uncharacterized protein n=1 Tax=Rhizopogon vinicolor AM-OR11-026 TaxID=1314800 RepID=A0A1B7MGX7_9AGAM|nr:hypothetical protein K503DRAFT_41098 [Rhizopogon vinicolor AM-OR11-026]